LYVPLKVIGVVSVVVIITLSYGIFFFLQNRTEYEVKNSLFEEQRQRQLETTKSLSQHIGSDLDLVTARLYAIANSEYMQTGDFTSNATYSFLQENFARIENVVDRLFVLDKDDVISASLSDRRSGKFASIDLSPRDWVKETKITKEPVLSNGFERLGVYSVFITHPIIDRETNQYIGLVGASMPTVNFFEEYGNVYDITSPFLAAYDKKGILLAVGASQDLVGKDFFGDYVQDFVNHNTVLNNLTRSLLAGNSGYAVYDYGRGERLTTQSPIYMSGEPTYFVQIITPTASIYTNINKILAEEQFKMFSLLAGTTAAVAVLIVFLVRWNSLLSIEVKRRTEELDRSNEQLRLANNQLQNHDKMQKEFIDIAAHELRTPIQPILGISSILSSTTKDRHQSELLDIITRNAKRLRQLAEDILDVSKIESERLKLVRTEFNLLEVIESVINEFQTHVREYEGKRSLSFVNHDSNVPIMVNADKQRLTQVITNLISNAIKFSKDEPTSCITLSVERIKRSEVNLNDDKIIHLHNRDAEKVSSSDYENDNDANGYALVKIKDTGQGIDPEIKSKLFTKFTSKSYHGTGLGLFISKSIISAHGGRIWAENNSDGKGASFFFIIPTSPTGVQEKSTGSIAPPAVNTSNV
jgi:signal transduction histidine kinase